MDELPPLTRVGAARPELRPAPARYSRWSRSSMTFGPVGRVVLTGLLLLPIPWLGSLAGPYGLPGLVLWVFVVLPLALRDVWRRVPVPAAQDDPLGIAEAIPPALPPLLSPPPPESAIESRRGPSRW